MAVTINGKNPVPANKPANKPAKKKAGLGSATVEVSKTKSGKEISSKTENKVVELPNQTLTVEPLADVLFDFSFTKNLGNYESGRIHVAVTLPTKVEDLDKTFYEARDWVVEKMEESVKELLEGD